MTQLNVSPAILALITTRVEEELEVIRPQIQGQKIVSLSCEDSVAVFFQIALAILMETREISDFSIETSPDTSKVLAVKVYVP